MGIHRRPLTYQSSRELGGRKTSKVVNDIENAINTLTLGVKKRGDVEDEEDFKRERGKHRWEVNKVFRKVKTGNKRNFSKRKGRGRLVQVTFLERVRSLYTKQPTFTGNRKRKVRHFEE